MYEFFRVVFSEAALIIVAVVFVAISVLTIGLKEKLSDKQKNILVNLSIVCTVYIFLFVLITILFRHT